MRLLLDAHTLLWCVDELGKLSAPAMDAMLDTGNELLLSAATIWELAIKVGQERIGLSMPYRQWLDTVIADLGLDILPITVAYGERQALLPPHHKDPFDRMMAAQALVDGIAIVSVDVCFDLYGVTRIW